MADLPEQQAQEPEVECTPQLAEVNQTIPGFAGIGCTGTYTIETPLLISTWEPDSVTVEVVSVTSRCSGTTAAVAGTEVVVTFAGTAGGSCSTIYLFDGVYDVKCGSPGIDPCNGATVSGTANDQTIVGLPTGVVINNIPNCSGGGATIQSSVSSQIGGITGTPCPGAGFNIVSYNITNVRKQNPSDPDCEDIVRVRYEGCSKKPSGTYGDDNPPPGGGSPGGGTSPGGSPPSDEPPATPPNNPPSGFGGSGGGGGNNPPPSPPSSPPGTSNPPQVSPGTSQNSGDSIVYPDETILTPEPIPEFPPLIVILPGGEPTQVPWNGYAAFLSISSGDVVVGTTYPALYVSPMLAQKTFAGWKALKHAFVQFDNRRGTDIHTALTTTDTLQRGKALHQFNANIGLIYNDEMSDEVVQELYRYDAALWTLGLYQKHFSPKQLSDITLFKEPLLGVSYSYQLAVFSDDAATWKLVGWQIEGKLKGQRIGHSRN